MTACGVTSILPIYEVRREVHTEICVVTARRLLYDHPRLETSIRCQVAEGRSRANLCERVCTSALPLASTDILLMRYRRSLQILT